MILFVVFVFLFHDFTEGLEYFPLLPVPERRPLAMSLIFEPRESGWVAERARCFAVPTV